MSWTISPTGVRCWSPCASASSLLLLGLVPVIEHVRILLVADDNQHVVRGVRCPRSRRRAQVFGTDDPEDTSDRDTAVSNAFFHHERCCAFAGKMIETEIIARHCRWVLPCAAPVPPPGRPVMAAHDRHAFPVTVRSRRDPIAPASPVADRRPSLRGPCPARRSRPAPPGDGGFTGVSAGLRTMLRGRHLRQARKRCRIFYLTNEINYFLK